MKKIICFALGIIILSSSIDVFAFDESVLKMEEDVLGSDGLNILPSVDKETITREEMVDIIINLTQI